jgi:23S rRNA (cytosine1962-C5)-methyltransferase
MVRIVPVSRFPVPHHWQMTDRAAHELIDAGGGRRLERFGELIVDRPAPMAEDPPRDPDAWTATDLRFDRYVGWTSVADGVPQPWVVEDGDLRFELRPTDTGQVGLFPEQAPSRGWVRNAVAEMIASAVPSAVSSAIPRLDAGADAIPRVDAGPDAAPGLSVLNLFAYTGAMTLAAAATGAAVAHVDGSRPAVAWARHNAELSGLADRPIRWLVDDVETFVGREIRRERRYDAVILDPPSYGHGSRGTTWRLEDRLDPLLDACAELTGDDPAFVLLTAHTPGFGTDRLADALAGAFGRRQSEVEAGELGLRARSGAHLRLGAWARIIRE